MRGIRPYTCTVLLVRIILETQNYILNAFGAHKAYIVVIRAVVVNFVIVCTNLQKKTWAIIENIANSQTTYNEIRPEHQISFAY